MQFHSLNTSPATPSCRDPHKQFWWVSFYIVLHTRLYCPHLLAFHAYLSPGSMGSEKGHSKHMETETKAWREKKEQYSILALLLVELARVTVCWCEGRHSRWAALCKQAKEFITAGAKWRVLDSGIPFTFQKDHTSSSTEVGVSRSNTGARGPVRKQLGEFSCQIMRAWIWCYMKRVEWLPVTLISMDY